MNVWYSSGENAHLSNLAERPFTLSGFDFVSVEHAYQSMKSGKMDLVTFNREWRDGTKIRGRFPVCTDYGFNVSLMLKLVRESFVQNPESARALRRTAPEPITHRQAAAFWRTQFPRILEAVRIECGA